MRILKTKNWCIEVEWSYFLILYGLHVGTYSKLPGKEGWAVHYKVITILFFPLFISEE